MNKTKYKWVTIQTYNKKEFYEHKEDEKDKQIDILLDTEKELNEFKEQIAEMVSRIRKRRQRFFEVGD